MQENGDQVIDSRGSTALDRVSETVPSLPRLNEANIAVTRENIQLCQKLVREVLEAGVDYGLVPGVPQPFLWDPGAGKIMAAFNLFAEHRVLSERIEPELVSYLIAARLVHRDSGKVVAEGIGAASTEETKHKYRWVRNPVDYGHDAADFKGRSKRRARDGSGLWEYHIPNPERGELQNVVAKMAAKRAESDACQSLPGVGSTLRKLFSGKSSEDKSSQVGIRDYSQFWGETRRMGWPDADAVHQALGVGSIKALTDKGETLDQVIQRLRGIPPPAKSAEDIPGLFDEDLDSPMPGIMPPRSGEAPGGQSEQGMPTVTRDTALIRGAKEFYHACYADFQLQPKKALQATGCSSEANVRNWEEAYLQVAAMQGYLVLQPKVSGG